VAGILQDADAGPEGLVGGEYWVHSVTGRGLQKIVAIQTACSDEF